MSGAVREDKLAGIPEKQRVPLLEKLRAQVVEREQNQAMTNGAAVSEFINESESMPEDNTNEPKENADQDEEQ